MESTPNRRGSTRRSARASRTLTARTFLEPIHTIARRQLSEGRALATNKAEGAANRIPDRRSTCQRRMRSCVTPSQFDSNARRHTRRLLWVDSTSSQLTRAAVQAILRAAIQPVSSLSRRADVWLDCRSTSRIGGSGHRLAKSQRLQPASTSRT